METLVQIAGWIFLAIIGFFLIVLIKEVIWAAICSASNQIWTFRCAIANGQGDGLRWSRLPEAFFRGWVEYFGYRNDGNTTLTRQYCGSQWRGPGDYSIKVARNEEG